MRSRTAPRSRPGRPTASPGRSSTSATSRATSLAGGDPDVDGVTIALGAAGLVALAAHALSSRGSSSGLRRLLQFLRSILQVYTTTLGFIFANIPSAHYSNEREKMDELLPSIRRSYQSNSRCWFTNFFPE